jgi:hypothetical protein
MSLVKRRIDVTITLGTGSFGETIGQTITLTNHRVEMEMHSVGGDAKGECMLAIYGLRESIMNQLTTIGPVMTAIRGKNSVSVSAGDDGSALTNIFQGTIDSAFADFKNAPEVPLRIHAFSALVAAVKPIAALSIKGDADVAGVMGTLAKQMGLTLENNGVKGTLHNPYFPGTAWQQMRACAKAAGITAFVERDKLVILPPNTPRKGNVPLISKDTGLMGYPTFSSQGLGLRTLFHPDIQMGGQVKVQSELQVACGLWNVFSVYHRLEALKPSGAWDTELNCYRAPT